MAEHEPSFPRNIPPGMTQMAIVALLGAGITQGMQLLDVVDKLNAEIDALANSIAKTEICITETKPP